MARRSLALAGCSLALLLPGSGQAHPGHAATVVTVRDSGLSGRYEPGTATVVVGDDVVWIWRGQLRAITP